MRTLVLIGTLAMGALLPFVHETAPLAATAPPAGTWRIDSSRSMVQFTVTKLGFRDVPGTFGEFSGCIRYDPEDPGASAVRWTVRTASVRTDERDRDRALQAVEYFDSARHPEMTFRSGTVRPLGAGRLRVDGVISIKGRSRPLSTIVEAGASGFESRFELDRFDFDIVGGTIMRRLIGRMVRVALVAVPGEEAACGEDSPSN